jgi:ATP-binding cassette subfamily B protein
MIGQVLACYYLLTHVMPALNRLGETSVSLRDAAIAWRRLKDIWLVPRENITSGRSFKYFDHIKIVNGTFAWENSIGLWANINIIIGRGCLTGLTGPSGSGKTTLLGILHRKYDLVNGNLYLDDHPASWYRLNEYRRRITLVPQHIHLFKASLADNILLGRPPWYLKDLLQKFPYSDWLKRFDQGLSTMLGGGHRKLSGGEKQMIGLLRALYARPDMLLIDESLNALDHETREWLLYSLKIFALTGGVLVCTHDHEVLSQMDEVYVLENRKLRKTNAVTGPSAWNRSKYGIGAGTARVTNDQGTAGATDV